MRFIHISDLHLGKNLNGYSLLQQQEKCLQQVVDLALSKACDALFIAGDIYDKTSPSNEAISLFDRFLTQLHMHTPQLKICIIAGNHDSFAKISYGKELLEKNNIYIQAYPLSESEILKSLYIKDEYGMVKITFAPFCKPSYLLYKNKMEGMTYTQMFNEMLNRSHYDASMRHVLLAHQFFVNANGQVLTSESEVLPLVMGGLDSIDLSQLDVKFHYMAFGHLHRFQQMGKLPAYYSGSIYPYSISEAYDTKGVIYGQMDGEGKVDVELIPLIADKKIQVITGEFNEIMQQYHNRIFNDYVAVKLTSPCYDPNLQSKLLTLFPNLLEVTLSNASNNLTETRDNNEDQNIDGKDPLYYLQSLMKTMQGKSLTQEQTVYLQNLLEQINEAN